MATQLFASLKAPRAEEGCWPTAAHELLLHAAVSPPERALAAWREWSTQFDLERDHIDIGSYRLLPLVFAHLLRHRPDAPKAKLVQGLYKRAWFENHVRFHQLSRVLSALHEAGIPTLMLKGCPLSILHYRDIGARPMFDLDLLVPKPDAFAAARVLAALGWAEEGDVPMTEAGLDLVPGRAFINGDGLQIDLHCHVLHYGLSDRITGRFWEASVPIEVGGVATRALSAADQLLHVCAHGLMWSAVPPVRWIADAMAVISSVGERLDWQRLMQTAPSCNASLPLLEALTYLREHYAALVPLAVTEGLAAAGATRTQARLYRTLTNGGRWRNARMLWLEFRLNERYIGRHHHPAAFLEYLRIVLGKDNSWQVLRWAAARTAMHLRDYFRAPFSAASRFRRRSSAALSTRT